MAWSGLPTGSCLNRSTRIGLRARNCASRQHVQIKHRSDRLDAHVLGRRPAATAFVEWPPPLWQLPSCPAPLRVVAQAPPLPCSRIFCRGLCGVVAARQLLGHRAPARRGALGRQVVRPPATRGVSCAACVGAPACPVCRRCASCLLAPPLERTHCSAVVSWWVHASPASPPLQAWPGSPVQPVPTRLQACPGSLVAQAPRGAEPDVLPLRTVPAHLFGVPRQPRPPPRECLAGLAVGRECLAGLAVGCECLEASSASQPHSRLWVSRGLQPPAAACAARGTQPRMPARKHAGSAIASEPQLQMLLPLTAERLSQSARCWAPCHGLFHTTAPLATR